MKNEDQVKTSGSCFGAAINRVASSEASTHFGNAVREVLLAMQSVVDAVLERKEQKAESKLQKVTIE